MNKIKCKKCGYEWITKSILLTVSCPSCATKNKTINNKESENYGK